MHIIKKNVRKTMNYSDKVKIINGFCGSKMVSQQMTLFFVFH